MKKFNKLTELIIIAASLLVITFFWNTKIIYPIKLSLILFHEASHALAAYVTGGKVIGIELNRDLSGGCIIENGNDLIIALSGYPGSYTIAIILFFSAYNNKLKTITEFGIPAALIFITANFINNSLISIIVLFIAVSFFIVVRFTPSIFSNLFFKITGLIGLIYVVDDILSDYSQDNLMQSDVALLSYLSGIPRLVWIIIWILIFVVLFFYGCKKIIITKN
ncbi:M50 family metallopeptidase [Melioribacter sp. OK-6-Me]|uniref:M50 family metallopeptidase n=1 Tax=unclassified Melioribacter TaxID=2627329 RepID=UPI003ED89931